MNEEIPFYISGRQEGKTTALLDWVRQAPRDEHRVIVCHNYAEAARLLAQHGDLSYQNFASYQQIDRGGPQAFDKRGQQIVLGVDNVELFVRRYTSMKYSIGYLTATGRQVFLPF